MEQPRETPDSPAEILAIAYEEAEALVASNSSLVDDKVIARNIELVARNTQNRAVARALLACSLAKLVLPEVDIRRPYTAIQTADSFSGRSFDEDYLTSFVAAYDLQCNDTTAFLTPALRNISTTLTKDLNIEGRPRQLYKTMLTLLDDAFSNRISARQLLVELTKWLIIVRNEKRQRMSTLLADLKATLSDIPLSSEDIVSLVEQHLNVRGSSRLPVIVVAAAYNVVDERLGEQILPLRGHNAADSQTGSQGDVEVKLISDNRVVTIYEMKAREVTVDDINHAVSKIVTSDEIVDNYIFITTKDVDDEVVEIARQQYSEIGVEVVVLDCIGFLRHFLHLFHRTREAYIDEYQRLLLLEPDSAVGQSVKEAFLLLRHAAETARGEL